MCGIGGFSINPKDFGSIDPDLLAGSLLMALEIRGRHATGAAWFSGGKISTRKDAVPASTWVKRGAHKSNAFTRILHTRFATQGSPDQAVNNHPIAQGSIVGTHNGTLDFGHDDEIFAMLGAGVPRHGEVDSEAIFALLAHGGLTTPEALALLRGRVAVAWLDTRDPVRQLHLARVSGSPLAVGQTRNGSFIYASTMPILLQACEHADVKLVWKQVVSEGQYWRIHNGAIVEVETFEPASGFTPAAPATSAPAKQRTKRSARTKARKTGRLVFSNDTSNHVYTPSEWDWDDPSELSEYLAQREEQMMFGDQ